MRLYSSPSLLTVCPMFSHDTTHFEFPQRCLSIAPCPSHHNTIPTPSNGAFLSHPVPAITLPSQLPLHLYLPISSSSSSSSSSLSLSLSYADPWGLGDYTRDYRRAGVAQSHKEEDQEGEGERATVARWINGIVPVRTTMPYML
jgi:hypothetical protein